MKGHHAIALAIVLAATTGGCAWWDAHGWKGHRAAATASDNARAQCDAAVATLKGRPDHDTALAACLDEKARRGK